MIRTLLIDNYDSFTYNLYHLIAAVNGRPPLVIPNDDPRWTPDLIQAFDNVVISPGPGRPENPTDFGICRCVVAQTDIPVFGICLGHQGICHFHGGLVDLAPNAWHGRLSSIFHSGTDLFENIPSPFTGVRYHSLTVRSVPDTLEVIARSEDNLIMGVRHRTLPQWGVQFHPESICTEFGRQLFDNFRKLTEDRQKRCPARPRTLSCFPPLSGTTGSNTLLATHLFLLHRQIDCATDAETVFDHFFNDSDYAVWLDSNRQDYGLGRFSFLCKADGPLGRMATVDVNTHRIRIHAKDGIREIHSGFFDWLEEDLNRHRIQPRVTPFEFSLGWIGYIGYEIKADCAAASPHQSPYPDATLLFCDRGIVIDHEKRQIHLLALASPETREAAEKWLKDAGTWLIGTESRPPMPLEELPACLELTSPFVLRHSKKKYLDLIRKSQEYIRQGETYEVCLTNTASGRSDADPWTAYRLLRRRNPAPYSAYLKLNDLCILSCSPERFLKISRNRTAESKPIKGTRGRSDDPIKDRALHDELATSEKENAENLMIVDLVRHDLGKTAELNSVNVPSLFAVESYQTVHQMVSTITSTLRPDVSSSRCIQEAFPGGSMTGAPKRRTLQILDELEEGARGVYSGALGYFSLCGAVDLSIVIRTLVMSRKTVTFGVGGAITALSDPEAEFDEIRVKAKAFLDLFETGFPDEFT